MLNENIELNDDLISINVEEINRYVQRIKELNDENERLEGRNRKLRNERKFNYEKRINPNG